MGINFILPLIAGIVMTVILGTQVAPSLVENMKIKKVENRAISNQIAIKDAIVRYISLTGKYPKDFDDLKSQGLLKDYHEDNSFSGGYSFLINEEKGTLTIYTQFDDDKAGNYFKNSFSTPNKPICVEKVGETCKGNLYETFYLLPIISMEKGNELDGIKVGSKEYIEKVFTEEKLGDKEYYVENPPKDGDKDYVYVAEDKVEEFIYDKINNEWVSNGEKVVGGLGKSSGVEIKNVEIPQQIMDVEGIRSIKNELFEKVVCRDTTLELGTEGVEVFVINENTGLGEIVWVAPSTNSVSEIQDKIFTKGFTPNNICTSNVGTMQDLFDGRENFNSRLDRWDTSNVISMNGVFYRATKFDQDIGNWDVSKVTDTSWMFGSAIEFNRPIGSWDVGNVKNVTNMFHTATKFNQPIGSWNVKNVEDMYGMFYEATKFNQPLDDWNVSNVKYMNYTFWRAIEFNQPIGSWNVSNVVTMYEMFRGAEKFNQPIGNWDVGSVEDENEMYEMFYEATKFNQDLSTWCVTNIGSEPYNFDYNASAWSLPRPQWGTCPNP